LLLFSRKGSLTTTSAFSAFAYSPGFALVDFFLFWRVKEELMDLSLGRHSLKETLVGVIRTFTND
jgi:hypothetical protein